MFEDIKQVNVEQSFYLIKHLTIDQTREWTWTGSSMPSSSRFDLNNKPRKLFK